MELSARAAAAAGAQIIRTPHAHAPVYTAQDDTPDRALLERFIKDDIWRGVRPCDLPLFSAHQMGSARMGASPRDSVCDPRGEVHAVRGLYIADASAFPSASGVNPMITTAALSHFVATGIARRWKQGERA